MASRTGAPSVISALLSSDCSAVVRAHRLVHPIPTCGSVCPSDGCSRRSVRPEWNRSFQ